MTHSNRLAHSKSPYLLQHKNNPVDWYPWGDEAFAAAKDRHVPIFLSVGYSTCHWCHVMEKESFENEEIATIMNDHFVNIKVDKEERPDVDRLYMNFIQAMTGGGGWPMSVFLTPDLAPITGGTYFPPGDSMGRPGFPTVLRMVAKKWHDNAEGLATQGATIMNAIEKTLRPHSADPPNFNQVMSSAFAYKKRRFDTEHGGFGEAPKFPQPVDLDFLLHYSICNKGTVEGTCAGNMLSTTLSGMDRGGIHDHIGKGFHRYSTDAEWHVPHFEKMLYDQAQLLATYADFYIRTGTMEHVVKDILDYVDHNLTHKEDGGFYSAEDADSLPVDTATEKKEGAFCVWTQKEIDEILSHWKVGERQLTDILYKYFGIVQTGNVKPSADPHGELRGQNVLIMRKSHEDFAVEFGMTVGELKAAIEEGVAILSTHRALRPKPHLDTKIVTCWQGLMLTGLCKAFSALKDPAILERAVKNVAFIKKYLINQDGTLRRAVYTSQTGEIEEIVPPICAFSDDYAYLIQGLLDLYEVTLDEQYIQMSITLQSILDVQYWDADSDGGYYVSTYLSEDAPHMRIMEDQDGAEPSSNSVAVGNLIRLHELTDNKAYYDRAMKILRASADRLGTFPYALCKMIPAYARIMIGPVKIVIVGSRWLPETRVFVDLINSFPIWNKSVVLLEIQSDDSFLEQQCPQYTTLKKNVSQPTVFICKGFTCGTPMTTEEELKKKLDLLKDTVVLAKEENYVLPSSF